MERLKRRPSTGTILGVIALVVALGGTGYAVTKRGGNGLGPATAQKLYYRAPNPSPPETILNRAGLRLRAECLASGGPDLLLTAKARTLGSFKAWGVDEDSDVIFDSSSAALFPDDPAIDVLGSEGNVESIGTITWNTKDRRVLTIDFQVESNPINFDGCMLAGTVVSG